MTREFWHFDEIDKPLIFVGRQWKPGIYEVDNKTARDLEVIGGGTIKAGRVAILKAHGHGI